MIETTEEEIEAYYIVKGILSKHIDPERIFYRDNTRYFTIIIDDNNRKNVCRLYLNSETKKKMVITNENKEEEVFYLGSIVDIYQYSDLLTTIALNHAKDQQ